MFEIVSIEESTSSEGLSSKDYLDQVTRSRERVASLGRLLAQISGFLASANLITLFFYIREQALQAHDFSRYIASMHFASLLFLCIALFLAILAADVKKPLPAAKFGDVVKESIVLFVRERSFVKLGSLSLLIAIVLFLSSMVMFAWTQFETTGSGY